MRLNQIYIGLFTTNDPTTGSPFDADRLPEVSVFRNGNISDIDIDIVISAVSANPSTDGGVYKIIANTTWSDSGFLVDDKIDIYIFAIIDGVESHAIIDSFILDNGAVLAEEGLDNILTTEPSGRASNFREMIVQLYMRFFNKTTLTDSVLTVCDDGDASVTTQVVSDDDTTQTVNKAIDA